MVATLALSFNAVDSSTIYRSFTDEKFEDTSAASSEDFDDEPIYQPRFLPFFQDNAATIGKVVEALQNPENKTLQDNLFNLVTDVALKQFGGDEMVKKVIEVVKNSQNKTFKDIVMDVAAEVAIVKLGGEDETIRKIAEVLKNPGNKTIQENFINLAADIADTKLKGNGTINKVAEVLQRPGNRTLQENLLNVVFEVGVSKYGENQLFMTVADVYRNSGNKTMQENLLNLATSVALTQFGNNPIIKMVATSLQNSGNGTLTEKLSSMADAALTAGLGPVQAAIIKQGIGIAGQALKVGGSLLGGAMSDIGGDSALGKAGRAIGNGSLAVGGLMSNFGGGDKGVGAVIEKFGESLKGKNVTVQEAFETVGSTMGIPLTTVEKELSEGIEEVVKTEEKLVDTAQTETESNADSTQTSSDSSKDDTVSQLVANVPTTSNKKVVEAETTEETSREISNHETIEQNHKSLTTSGLQVSRQKKTGVTNDAIVLADKSAKMVNAPVEQRAEVGLTEGNQVISSSKQTTAGSQTTTNNFVNRFQNSEITPEMTTDSFNGNSNSQSVVSSMNNFGEIVRSNQVGSGFVADSSRRNVESAVVQGMGSSSDGALGSAAQAIEAARQALQAGGEALGGVLGSGASSSGNSGISMRQNGGVMNIEVTTVKLNMI